MKFRSPIGTLMGLTFFLLGGLISLNVIGPQRFRLRKKGFTLVVIDLGIAILMALGMTVMAISVTSSLFVIHVYHNLWVSVALIYLSNATFLLIVALLRKRHGLL